ncbi:MAG: ABC transporter permease [Clostridia bacterium]|nr:ABC transporter permease [Clostridia bacterium]
MQINALINALPGAVSQGLVWGIMAIGLYITYKVLEVSDLTVDGSIATGAAVATMLIINGWNVYAAILAAFAAGMLAGLLTGIFHTTLGIPAILAGILTQLGLYSINLHIMADQANVSVSVRKYDLLVSSMYVRSFSLDNPLIPLLIMSTVVILFLYWFFGTEYGCAMRATGANGNMARAQGINTNICKVVGLMISNGIVAVAGALLCQYQGFSDVKMGQGAIVIGLAAIIIAEVLFSKVFRNFALKLVAVSIGAVIYYLVIQVVLWLGLDTDDLKLLSALVVALFLGAPYLKGKLAAARLASKGGKTNA